MEMPPALMANTSRGSSRNWSRFSSTKRVRAPMMPPMTRASAVLKMVSSLKPTRRAKKAATPTPQTTPRAGHTPPPSPVRRAPTGQQHVAHGQRRQDHRAQGNELGHAQAGEDDIVLAQEAEPEAHRPVQEDPSPEDHAVALQHAVEDEQRHEDQQIAHYFVGRPGV